MSDPKRRERGLAKFNEVYCGDLPAPPPGTVDFFDLMLEQLFAEVWTRPALSLRDRRLVIMGVAAALGDVALSQFDHAASLGFGSQNESRILDAVRDRSER